MEVVLTEGISYHPSQTARRMGHPGRWPTSQQRDVGTPLVDGRDIGGANRVYSLC